MIFFATPCHRATRADLQRAVDFTTKIAISLKLEIELAIEVNNPLLSCARANLIEKFLATDCQSLFFRDDDVFFGPDVLDRMIKKSSPIVIAPYRGRMPPHHWTTIVDRSGQIQEAGLGATLIQRHVIETIHEMVPIYEECGKKFSMMFEHILLGKRLLREDYAFFHRALAAGFPTVALDAEVNHGGVVSRWPDAESFQRTDGLVASP